MVHSYALPGLIRQLQKKILRLVRVRLLIFPVRHLFSPISILSFRFFLNAFAAVFPSPGVSLPACLPFCAVNAMETTAALTLFLFAQMISGLPPNAPASTTQQPKPSQHVKTGCAKKAQKILTCYMLAD